MWFIIFPKSLYLLRAMYLSQSEVLWSLARLECNHQPPVSSLAPEARRQFMKAMVLAGCGIRDSSQEEQYWKLVSMSRIVSGIRIFHKSCPCTRQKLYQ